MVGMGSVGTRVGGVKSCLVACLSVGRGGGVKGASILRVHGSIPVPSCQDSVA